MRLFIIFISVLCLNLTSTHCHQHSAWEHSVSLNPVELLNTAKEPEFFKWMTDIRRKIHECPEVGFDLNRTTQLVKSELIKLGIDFVRYVNQTGFVATIGSGKQPWFALRADMDGLPIEELVEWEHRSKIHNRMHACGHDAHTAMLLGAAKLLQSKKDQLKGTVKLVFQPAEEGYAGAHYMLKEGALKNVKGIFGLHILPQIPVGEIASRPGKMLAGAGSFEVLVQGKGGHGGLPHLAKDPVVAASMAIIALQQIVSRETDPLEGRVVTVGSINGGKAGNVIPDEVTFGGTFRGMSMKSLSFLRQRIKEIVEKQAAVHNCNATINFMEDKEIPYPPTENDEALYNESKQVGEKLLGKDNVRLMPMVTGSEDFAFYTQEMPGAFFFVGTGNKTLDPQISVHNPYLVIDENVLPIGAAFHASVAISYLEGHSRKDGSHLDELMKKMEL